MTNTEIKKQLRVNEIRMWELAEAIGVSDPTLNRWLRHELTGERLERVEVALGILIEKNKI